MSRKAIRRKEKIYVNEDVTGFRKDKVTGFYKIVTQRVVRETVSGDLKTEPEKESDDLYKISNESDFDYKFGYNDFDGNLGYMYLKKCEGQDEE